MEGAGSEVASGTGSAVGWDWLIIDALTIGQVYVPQPMHDKPYTTPTREFALPNHAVLAMTGRDAQAFAQAQFMNDVAALGDGQWQWSGWLTPKGRVIALFALLRLDAQTLWLLLPDGNAAALAEQLRRYVFRSKVSLDIRDDLHVGGCFSPPAQAAAASMAHAGDRIELDLSGDADPRQLWIDTQPAATDAEDLARWLASDLRHGLPHLPMDQTGQWTPQQLSLERLRAFSIKKGCYPGQEIVARTHFLGQAKRGLALLDTDTALAAGAEVGDGARALGTVVSSVGTLALAVLPLERGDAPLSSGGTPVRERPLAGGLAR